MSRSCSKASPESTNKRLLVIYYKLREARFVSTDPVCSQSFIVSEYGQQEPRRRLGMATLRLAVLAYGESATLRPL